MIEPNFDPAAILAALGRHGVDYVLGGGYAANLYGAVRPTRDIDVAPATTADNLTRLIAALREPDGSGWVVLADPEGNEFCILRSDAERPACRESRRRTGSAAG